MTPSSPDDETRMLKLNEQKQMFIDALHTVKDE
jgi:hypothetical protein